MDQEIFSEIKPTGIKELDDYSSELKMRVLLEAFRGKKDLATILAENQITEETFYLWKKIYL